MSRLTYPAALYHASATSNVEIDESEDIQSIDEYLSVHRATNTQRSSHGPLIIADYIESIIIL